MKPYLLSLGAGLLVGIVYSLLNVRSPAPPTIALIGLLGILLGEQVIPVAKRLFAGHEVAAFLRTDCAEHVLGQLPGHGKGGSVDARVDGVADGRVDKGA